VRTTDRIPGFAICARCGVRRNLASCSRCGLLVCSDCRGHVECAVCYGERLVESRRAERRARLRELGRRAAVVALVTASGVTGLGAALLPQSTLCMAGDAGVAGSPIDPGPAELRLEPMPNPMPTPHPRTAAWGEPLMFRCYEGSDGLTCCIVAPR
jgi:hypothetical protein